MFFHDRQDAGRQLAAHLDQYAGRSDVIVLALPRGGVPVGYEVARALGAPLDVFLVRKLGVPGHEELAMGAIASGGVRVLNEDVVSELRISDRWVDVVADRELAELRRREEAYRDGRPAPDVRGLKKLGPAKAVVAVPVGAAQTCRELEPIADEVVCAEAPDPFYAVGTWYQDFDQTTDDEVRELLARAGQPDGVSAA